VFDSDQVLLIQRVRYRVPLIGGADAKTNPYPRILGKRRDHPRKEPSPEASSLTLVERVDCYERPATYYLCSGLEGT